MDSYTVQQLDEMCGRIERLTDTLTRSSSIVGPREDQVVSDVVQVIQRMGEGIAWAYGQRNRPGLGEQFAMPFVDRRIRERLKALLTERRSMKKESRNRVAAQILQTIHILLQALPEDSTLYCALTAGWYLNDVVATPLDFRETEDLLPLWMTVVKDIATMLNGDNMMLFFDPGSSKPFPIFSEAVRYFHHPVAQVRTHVQATTLEIFLKLRDEGVWTEPIFQLILADASVFFTHVACLLREFWRMADDACRQGARRDARSALYIQNDILLYLNDVFACEIPQLSAILQEKLLRFAILPVLVRSALRPAGAAGAEDATLTPHCAWYLLHDTLDTLRNAPVFASVAFCLLRPKLPEEVYQLLTATAPRTPTQYLSTQAGWGAGGGASRQSAFANPGAEKEYPDEVLYAMPPTTIVALLEVRDAAQATAKNSMLDSLDAQLADVSGGGDTAVLAGPMLGVVVLLLRTLRAASEELARGVGERLGASLFAVLAGHTRLRWSALESALVALRELAAAADVPLGRARLVLGQPLQEGVLGPLATELFRNSREAAEAGGAAREAWLQDFQAGWQCHQKPLADPNPQLLQRDLLERGPGGTPLAAAGPGAKPVPADDTPGAPPDGRARCLRVLLCARRLSLSLLGVDAGDSRVDEMPGLDEAESEESAHFLPGVAVHIGKTNRVKCQVQDEVLYLLPAKALLVLVRPDEQKPFWAVPVIVEPLRGVRLGQGNELTEVAENAGSNGESQRVLRLEVSGARSPFLQAAAQQAALGRPPMQGMRPFGADRLAHTEGFPGLMNPGPMEDRIAHSVPMAPMLQIPGLEQPGGDPAADVAPLCLIFADERRRRVACKIFVQARHAVCQRMAEGLDIFLSEVRDEREP